MICCARQQKFVVDPLFFSQQLQQLGGGGGANLNLLSTTNNYTKKLQIEFFKCRVNKHANNLIIYNNIDCNFLLLLLLLLSGLKIRNHGQTIRGKAPLKRTFPNKVICARQKFVDPLFFSLQGGV